MSDLKNLFKSGDEKLQKCFDQAETRKAEFCDGQGTKLSYEAISNLVGGKLHTDIENKDNFQLCLDAFKEKGILLYHDYRTPETPQEDFSLEGYVYQPQGIIGEVKQAVDNALPDEL